MNINIREEFYNEAYNYARVSRSYTANRHDFHEGGLDNKQKKMFEGKLGEKIFKEYLIANNQEFKEDETSYKVADNYDFIINNFRIDVKTRTKSFHKRTLEIVEQFEKRPKEIYISVFLNDNLSSGRIIGWCTREDFIVHGRIENNGYLDNYVLYDDKLRDINLLLDYINV